MSVDSGAIDAALVTRLLNDTTLMAYAVDGVFFEEAAPKSTRFVIVSLIDEHDEPMFGGRAWEDALYLVKFVALASTGVNARAAAARIDVLLEDQPLTASGYTWMTMHREARIRMAEVDQIDSSIRWIHFGGHYRVMMSVGAPSPPVSWIDPGWVP